VWKRRKVGKGARMLRTGPEQEAAMNGPGAGRRADVGDVQRERAPRALEGP
jgi:hypothetical protein